MDKSTIRLLCKIYSILILLVAALLSAVPYSLLTLSWLLVLLYVTLRPVSPRFNVAVATATVFLVPLAIEPLLNQVASLRSAVPIIAAILAIPILYVLDYNLRQNAQHTPVFVRGKKEGRYITSVSTSLLAAATSMLLLSFILNRPTLLFTDVLFTLYLAGLLLAAIVTIPRTPVSTTTAMRRAIAGSSLKILLTIGSKTSTKIHARINPLDSWVKATPQRFAMDRDEAELELILTPPLAGPSRPEFQISAIDSRGFTQIEQLIKPVELRVIPRARYAEWLALKFLEQTGTGTAATSMPPFKIIRTLKRGLDYLDSRIYQPGDRLKDVDWKHTLKLSQLIIKDYIESGEKTAIIAVNLAVTDAEEADKLAFNLITTALTLAQENIPTTLTAYNHERVVLTTPATDPREIVKQTLSLVKDISMVESVQRYLQLPDITRLRRNISLLRQAKSEPAQRLLDLLSFESRAMEKATKGHPAATALTLASEHTTTPALIILVSQLNHDAEAVLVTTEKLSRRDFTTIRAELAG